MKTLEEIKEKAKKLGINANVYNSKGFDIALALLKDLSEEEIQEISLDANGRIHSRIRDEYLWLEDSKKELEKKESINTMRECRIEDGIKQLSSITSKCENILSILNNDIEKIPEFETAEFRDRYKFIIVTKGFAEIKKDILRTIDLLSSAYWRHGIIDGNK